ncbi:MAG: hypothetical protein AB7S75_16020 [Desulfococcaceae bacterium]
MRKIAVLFMFFQCLFCFEALGTDVYMGSGAAYNISNETVTLWVEEVGNDDSDYDSGTLKLKLWAGAEPYSGGTMNGYILAVYNLGTLDSGDFLDDIDASVSYDPPPYGTYYITLTLTEWNGSNDIIMDYASFEDRQTLGSEIEEETEDDSEDSGGSCFISGASSGIRNIFSVYWKDTAKSSGKQ